MITTLGYEEIKRLHEERVARSLRRYENTRSLVTTDLSKVAQVEPCQVVELPPMRQPEHRIGA